MTLRLFLRKLELMLKIAMLRKLLKHFKARNSRM